MNGVGHEAPPGWQFLYSRRWLGYFALLLVFSIACVWLGNWQFARRAEAQAEIARIDANYDAAATPLERELPRLPDFDENTQKWRTVSVRGKYIAHPLLARNRPGPQGVGSNVIQAFESTTGTVLFIDRGWVSVTASDSSTTAEAAIPAPPQGEIQLTARLRASEPMIPGRTSVENTVGSIHAPELAQLSGTQGRSFTAAYGMLVSETPSGAHGILPPKPERDEGPHLSYALQWYVFIVIACTGVVFAARKEYRGLHPESEQVRAQDRKRRERAKRKGPTDADIEDALLE